MTQDSSPRLKTLRRLAAALFVAAALAPPAGAAAAVELEVATWHWTEPARGAVLRKLVEQFVGEHPGITVKEVSVPFPRYVEQMLLRLAGGAPPDVLVATDGMLFTFLDRGHLTPFESLAPLARMLERDRPDLVDGQAVAHIGGQTYGVVSHYSTYGLLYNEKLLGEAGIAKPPTTPQEFLVAATKLTKAPEQFGYGTRHSINEEAGWWYEIAYWVHGFGGRWATGGRPSVNTPQVINAVRFFKQLYDAGVFPKGVDAATYRRMFWQEKIAMLTDNNAVYFIAKSQNPNLPLRAAPNPFSPPVTVGEISFYTIPKGAKHPQEAATFIEWYRRHLRELGMNLQNLVGSKAANTDILKAFPHLTTFVAAPLAENGGALPKGYEGRMPEFRHIVLQHVTNVLVNNADQAAEMQAAQTELETMRR